MLTALIFSHLVVGYLKRRKRGEINLRYFEPGLEWLK